MAEISIIVPVYKVEQYLDRCVKSILNQTYRDFELILVDDGSPDNCPRMCDEYAKKDSRIKVIHKENGGLSSARNEALNWVQSNSSSQWVTFVDSDDWVEPQYLQLMLKACVELNRDISVCAFKRVTQETDGVNNINIDAEDYAVEKFFVNHNVNAVIACAKLYKKDLFNGVRYPEGRLHEDEFTTYKLLFKQDKIAYVNNELYNYYINSQSITNSDWNPRRMDAIEGFKEQLEFFENMGNDALSDYTKKRILVCYREYFLLLKSTADIQLKEKWLAKIKHQYKLHLCKYKNAVPFRQNIWLYEPIFEKRTQIYWKIKAIKVKLKGKNNG